MISELHPLFLPWPCLRYSPQQQFIWFTGTLLFTQSTILNYLLYSANALWALPLYTALDFLSHALFKEYTVAQQCAGTAALTINVRLLSSRPAYFHFCLLFPLTDPVRGRNRVLESLRPLEQEQHSQGHMRCVPFGDVW